MLMFTDKFGVQGMRCTMKQQGGLHLEGERGVLVINSSTNERYRPWWRPAAIKPKK